MQTDSPAKMDKEKAPESNGVEKVEQIFEKVTLEQFVTMSEEERSKMSLNARKKLLKQEKRAQKSTQKEAEAKARSEAEMAARIEAARQVKIEEDKTLPTATQMKIKDLASHVGERVKIFGWVHRLRQDGKKLWFVDLRDGTGFIQVVLHGKLCQTYEAVTLCREAAIAVYGRWVVDENGRAKGTFSGHDLQADYWELVGASVSDIENRFTEKSSVDILLNERHMVLRGSRASSILRMRSIITQCFREHLFAEGYTELMPPTIVNTSCEGGSELFEFDFFEQKGYLTQSSQLYLETGIPAVGDCFCILPSYRAEKSQTRRHLAEFHHLEAERPFVTFDQLLDSIEHLVVDVVDRVIEKTKGMEDLLMRATDGKPIKKLEKPFLRMTYEDAVKYCREHNIYKDEETKTHFEFGDDIPEKPERQMTDEIGRPIMLCRFPASLKAFYMQKCDDDRRVTESVDVLLPGVGEVVGGSMRMYKAEELEAAYKNEDGADASNYGWYTDQRRYGTCPHGGYGLGLERFICFLLSVHHIRDVCMFPRYRGRISP